MEDRRAEPGPLIGGPSTASPTRTVLIADDEAAIVGFVAGLVEDLGYVPRCAADGRQALALARQQRPLLVITDLMMPHLNGTALIAAVRADAVTAGVAPTPIILMTAASLHLAEAAGADAVLHKPFDLDTLEALVQRLVR